MIVGIDSDVLVHWLVKGSPHHEAVRRFVMAELSKRDGRLGLTPQVLYETLHVCTDGRRFEKPMETAAAISSLRELWDAKETMRIFPAPTIVHRALELLESLMLGRKRILDTVLAATFEAAGVRRLATLNGRDFRIFPFLEVVDPAQDVRS